MSHRPRARSKHGRGPRGRGRVASISLSGGGTASPYSDEANALFARMTTQQSGDRKVLIDTTIRALKTAGLWPKLTCLYLLAANDSQAAQRNWIDNTSNITETGVVTFTQDRGYAGNGTDSYLDTNFNGAGFTGATNAYGVIVNVGGASNATLFGAVTTARQAINPKLSGASNSAAIRAGSATGQNTVAVYTVRTGHCAVSRDASGPSFYRDGAFVESFSSIGTSASVGNIAIGTSGVGGFADDRVSCAWLAKSQSLSAAEIASLHTTLSTYLTAIGA